MAAVEQTVLPLEFGDRLTREEFLRRWEMHPELKRAELIGGMVYVSSRVSIAHGEMEMPLATWLGVYMAATPGCAVGGNATTFLLDDCVQPDKHLRILPEYGGTSRVVDSYLHGPLELAAEVCLSNVAFDLYEKLDLYEAAGVQEYLAILLYEQEIRWHQLVGGSYEILPPDADGIRRSRVFPGLWLDGPALLRRDVAKLLATLKKGLTSPEHACFVERLAQRRR